MHFERLDDPTFEHHLFVDLVMCVPNVLNRSPYVFASHDLEDVRIVVTECSTYRTVREA